MEMKWHNLNLLTDHHTRPSPRWGHSGCTLPDPYIALFGGYSQSKYYNDTWVLNWTTMNWIQIQSQIMPFPRSNSTVVYDENSARILMFGGGSASNTRFNDLWQLKLNLQGSHLGQWKCLMACDIDLLHNFSGYPWPRTYHAGCLIGNYLIIHGGQGYGNDLDDLWALNLENLQWKEIKTINTPKGRRFHSSVVIGQELYIIGGCHDGYNCLNDVHCIDLGQYLKNQTATNDVLDMPQERQYQWQNIILSDSSAFIARWGHMSCQVQGNIYIFGGRSLNDHNEILLLSTKEKERKNENSYVRIKRINNVGTPKGRRRGCLWVVGSCMVLHGGFNGSYFEDLQFINLHTTDQLSFENNKIWTEQKEILKEEDIKQCDIHLYTQDHKILHIRTSDIRYAFPQQIRMIEFMEILAEMPYLQALKYLKILIDGYLPDNNREINKELLDDFEVIYGNTTIAAAQKRLLTNIIQQQTIIFHNNSLKPFKVTEEEIQRIIHQLQNDIFNDITIILQPQSSLSLKVSSKSLINRSQYFKSLIQSFSCFEKEPILLFNGKQYMLQYKLLIIYLHYGHMVIPHRYPLYRLIQCYQLAQMYAIQGARMIILQQILFIVSQDHSEQKQCLETHQVLRYLMQLCMKGDDKLNLNKILEVGISKLIIDSLKTYINKSSSRLFSNVTTTLFNQKNKINPFRKTTTLKKLRSFKNGQQIDSQDKENKTQTQIKKSKYHTIKQVSLISDKKSNETNIQLKLQQKIINIVEEVQCLQKEYLLKNRKNNKQSPQLKSKDIVYGIKQLYKLELSYYFNQAN